MADGAACAIFQTPNVFGALEDGPAEVMLALYDRRHATAIASGENQGRLIETVNVVRRIEPLGPWQGAAATWTVGDADLQPGRGGMTAFLLTPTHADILARAGWSKQRVKNFVAEYGRVPAYRHRAWYDDSMAYGRPFMTPFNATDTMSVISHPKYIEIVVCGGGGAFMGILCSSANNETFVHKKITLPKNWSKLVAKYRVWVPAYERY